LVVTSMVPLLVSPTPLVPLISHGNGALWMKQVSEVINKVWNWAYRTADVPKILPPCYTSLCPFLRSLSWDFVPIASLQILDALEAFQTAVFNNACLRHLELYAAVTLQNHHWHQTEGNGNENTYFSWHNQ
jgi:hypothetical protein